MKNFYKELLKREGGKRNLTAADVSEVLRHAADMIADKNTPEHMEQFEKYLEKKMQENLGRFYKVKCFIGFRAAKKKRG